MIAHKRIRVVGGRVEEAPRPFSYSSGFSKAQGWTDLRVIELPVPAVKDSRYVYEKGGSVVTAGKRQIVPVIAFNASYVDERSGQLLGRTVIDGKLAAPDIAGKTEKREHLYFKEGRFGIGSVPVGAVWGAQGSPRLRRVGKNVIKQQVAIEQTPPDIANGPNPRMAAGLKSDGTLVIVAVDGRGGGDRGLELDELGYVFDWLGCPDAINLDGGGSATLYTNVPELQRALGIKGDMKVCDLSAGGTPRKVHHAVVLQLEVTALFPPKAVNPILIIDPGHGGKDPGGGSNNFFLEKDKVLDISLYQAERFRQLGVPVALSRMKDVYLSTEDRTRAIRESGARYCISNHINAGGGDGAETIYSIYSSGELAKRIADAIAAEGQNIRRTFKRSLPSNPAMDYYFIHRDTGNVQTAIVEYGFADSAQDDIEQLKSEWREYAEAVVRAFCSFINHPYAPPASTLPVSNGAIPTAQREIGIQVNGQYVGVGYLINDTSYIPARVVAEKLGAKVGWDGKNVSITKELI
jgi:N-acetylmuramoyl-L-alanine amidase